LIHVSPISRIRPYLRRRILAMRRRSAIFMSVVAIFVAAAPYSAGQQPGAGEYQVKAVYLFNFGKFVTWPSPSSPKGDSFPICVLGTDPFGQMLDKTLAGEEVNGQKLVARRINLAREAADCRILFLGGSEANRIKETLATIGKSPVLTVGEMPGFLANGGMIQFVFKENKIHFSVNISAAERAGLVLSSQLLKVAIEARRDSDPVEGKR
jgi:hypothetical protein